VIFAVGLAYMLLIGQRLVPERSTGEDLAEDFEVDDFMTEIEIPEGSAAEGRSIQQAFGETDEPIEVLQLLRDDNLIEEPRDDFELQPGDRLAVRGDVERIARILDADDYRVSDRLKAERFRGAENVLLEVMLTANSGLDGESLRNHRFSERYNANVLAIRRSGRLRHKNLWDTQLKAGDVLLLHTTRRAQRRIRALESRHAAPFITINEHGLQSFEPRRFAVVLGVIVAVVSAASLELVPVAIAAIAGISLLAFGKILSMRDVYRSVDWRVVFLLAAALSFGDAMNSSGLTSVLSDALLGAIGEAWGPVAVVAALYLLTSVMTEIMSNNAAAALLAPIALSISQALGVDPLPLLLTVAFAGSASFMTPVGYQTNTMVYSAGNYRFGDFLRVGAPLNLILWVLATLLIPVFYPF
jgi:di/tricarboxylate transporter